MTIANILSTYERATDRQRAEGIAWYPTAWTFATGLAETFDLPGGPVQGAGVLAALSPQQSWGANQRAATKLCATGDTWGTGANKAKALRILQGEHPRDVLGGNKVRAFFACIAARGYTDEVCVDRHAAAIALGHDTSAPPIPAGFLTNKRYATIQEAYREAAHHTSHTPAQLQAITWLVRRTDKHPNNEEAFN